MTALLNGFRRAEEYLATANDVDRARTALARSAETCLSWLDGTHPKAHLAKPDDA